MGLSSVLVIISPPSRLAHRANNWLPATLDTAVLRCFPLVMAQGPPLEPMVTDAPAARGPWTEPQVQYVPSTEYATPMTTPAGVAAAPWFFTTLVKRRVALLYEREVGIKSGRD